MTNSSSASYFVIAPPSARLNLHVVDYRERAESSEVSWDGCVDYPWYRNNNRLVKISFNEWGSLCARAVASAADPLKCKRQMDVYTKRALGGDNLYYLVANRDDEEVPPTHYDVEDISDDAAVVLLGVGEEH